MVEEFKAFHRENPHIYELFKKFTLQSISRGREHFSARTVLHRIRWYTDVETVSPDGFKVNNNWSAFYARLFERDFPEHIGFFRNRESVADTRDVIDGGQSFLSLGRGAN